MPPIIPVGAINAIKPIDAMGSGMPKMRGPQGQTNKGDAGFAPAGGFQLPKVQLPKINPMAPPQVQEAQIQQEAPEDRPPVEHPMSVNGWLKNLSEDIYQFAAAIPASFKVAAQSGMEIAKNWRYLDDIFINHPELIGHELNVTGRQVIKGLTDTYKGGLGQALYKHPFSVLLDATGLFDLAGAGIKIAGKAALTAAEKATLKSAVETFRASKAALDAGRFGESLAKLKEAQALENSVWKSGSSAAKLKQLGSSVQSMPGRILKYPFVKSIDLLEKVPAAQKLMEAYAVDKMGRAEARALGSYQLNEKAVMEPQAKALFGKRIKKSEWEHFDDSLDYLPDSQITDQRILDRKREWGAITAEDERKFTELGIKTPEELEKAVLKQTALKLKAKGKFKGELYTYAPDELTGERVISGFTDEAYDAARRWISGENPWGERVKPVYKQFIHERSFNVEELLNALKAGEKSEMFRKWVSRFEQKTGKSPVVMDPDIWQARSLLQKGELMGTLKYWQDAITRLGKPIKKGGIADEGYVIAPPFLEKYISEGLPNARDLIEQKMASALKEAELAGADRAQAIHGTITEAQAELMSKVNDLVPDLRAIAANPADYMVQIPKQVAYLMQKSMFGPRGAWKFYDNVLNTWRDAILTFMPRYYVNNLLGNAVMLMFAGATPFNKTAALREGDLPGEAISSMLGMEAGGSSSYISKFGEAVVPGLHKNVRRFTNTMSDISDQMGKQVALGALAPKVLERQAQMGNVVASGLLAMDKAEDAVAAMFRGRREVLNSPIEELIQSRKAWKAGELDQIGRPRVRIDPVKQSIADGLKRDIQQLENRIQFEGNLKSTVSDGRGGYKSVNKVDELKAQLKMKADQLSKIDPNVTVAEMVGPSLEKMPELAKLAELQLRRKALQPYAALAEETVGDMEKFFGNYGRLHPLEREYIRRVIPFWTFSKTMFQLAFNLPFLRPKTSFLWHQFSKLMVDAIGDDRLPNRYRNMVPIGGDEEGNIVFLKIGGFNPFEQASQLSSVGGVPIPKFLDPRNNPLVKIGVESIGGYDLFTEKPFVKTTDFVSLNGSVKRYDPDLHRIETVIPQKPIIDSVFQQVPHMRVLAELVQSAGLSSDYLGVETPRNPDGTLTYNRQWWHALMRAGGFPISTQNPEKVKVQHELLKRGMIKRFRSASGRVDPTTRMQLESILRDLEKAEVYE